MSETNILVNTSASYGNATNPKTKRAIAVFTAVELIKADISSSTTGSKLDCHLDELSRFADKIEAALDKK